MGQDKRLPSMKWKYHIPIFLLTIWSAPALCQVPDSIAITSEEVPVMDTIAPVAIAPDTNTVQKKKKNFIGKFLSKEDYPNPKKAIYLSLVFPGGGQIYNKRWWKLPFVYGGYVGLILAIDYNTTGYKAYRDAYIAELAGEPHRFSASGANAGDLRRIRDNFDKNRQLSYIGIVALHMIQTAEAFVDCHLKTFDVSDDLSMRIAPKMGFTGDGSSYLGLGFTFQFSD
ncbi:MAG: DUF5683 domain-containing protein [Saprospiraceae bacterium]